MTQEEMKSWFINKFEQNFNESSFEDEETKFLEETLNSKFKFSNEDKKYLKQEYNDTEIAQAEKHTEKLLEKMVCNELKNKYNCISKTTYDFSSIDWQNLDEYDMIDMKKTLGLNDKEAEVLSSIWTLHNEHYHIGKKPDGSPRIIMIDKMTHHLSLKSLKGNVELTKLKYFTIQINESLLNEAYKVLNDDEIIRKYDLDYIDKQKGISKRVKNATKKIKDLNTGIVYESAKECAEELGKSNSFISKHKDRFIKI